MSPKEQDECILFGANHQSVNESYKGKSTEKLQKEHPFPPEKNE